MALLNRSASLVAGRCATAPRAFAARFSFSAPTRPPGGGCGGGLAASWSRWINETATLLRDTVLQIDYIAAQRLKRGNALASLYNRLYERDRLVELLRLFGRRVRHRCSRRLLWGGAFIGFYDWAEGSIPLGEMRRHCREIDICNSLTQKTLTCGNCGQRLKIEKAVENIRYCDCKDAPSSVYGHRTEDVAWTPFLERKDILVWRQEHPEEKGMYVYRMYGKFDDVTATEFLNVQLDMSEFRYTWDNSTAQCFVLDRDPNSSQDIYYWEVHWPRFFANRDYCCVRQTYTDPETGVTVLTSRSTQHPQCPQKRKCMRVADYMAVLTVKPLLANQPDQPGIEFSLTAYENPGVQLPESIITWVAIRGMPEYMNNLRKACSLWRTYNSNISTQSAHRTGSCSVESQSAFTSSSPSQASMGPGAIFA